MPGAQDPTIAYLIHRGLLVGIMIMILISFGYLLFQWAPEILEWVISSVRAVRESFTWELF